jgi:hypothetical protein
MKFDGNSSVPISFSQSFVLTPQGTNGFYVKSDILRFNNRQENYDFISFSDNCEEEAINNEDEIEPIFSSPQSTDENCVYLSMTNDKKTWAKLASNESEKWQKDERAEVQAAVVKSTQGSSSHRQVIKFSNPEDGNFDINRSIYVSGLVKDCSSNTIKQLFSKFGNVQSVEALKQNKFFVTFEDANSLTKALEEPPVFEGTSVHVQKRTRYTPTQQKLNFNRGNRGEKLERNRKAQKSKSSF